MLRKVIDQVRSPLIFPGLGMDVTSVNHMTQFTGGEWKGQYFIVLIAKHPNGKRRINQRPLGFGPMK